MNVGILGVGYYVPLTIKTNQDLINEHGPFYSRTGRIIDAEGIRTRTGIEERHAASPEEQVSDLAFRAALAIIEKANIPPEQIGCCIVLSSTPEMFFPPTACIIQGELQKHFPNIQFFPCFDILGACAGSVYGLILAKALAESKTCRYVLIIGSEVLTKICGWQFHGNEPDQKGDWESSSLFGDGAGGVLVGQLNYPKGFLAVDWGTDGSLSEIARSDGFGTRFAGIKDCEPRIFIDGERIYEKAVQAMTNGAINAVNRAGLSLENVRMVILHQANERITEAIDKRLQRKGLPKGRVPSNIANYGNTSTASPFILLAEQEAAGNLKKEDVVVISTVGSGLTWAAIALRW